MSENNEPPNMLKVFREGRRRRKASVDSTKFIREDREL
jgi:hypothetical protein